ncbi:MAG TPA: hypothetical protein VKX28_23760 [Xanthobacteraceae bacterium]|nr:hypothetical protein [Xanthobacteraceae bacterium]
MPPHGPTRLSSFVLFSTAAWLAVSTGTVRAADDCIVKPTSEAPHGQHWYYRTRGEPKRPCWYLGAMRPAARSLTPSDAHAPATAAALDAATLTPHQRESLFRKYVAWRRAHSTPEGQ